MFVPAMGHLIYLNGSLLDAEHARLSVFDRGLLYGDGIFETMRSYSGRIHLLRRHLDRLQEGARFLGISIPAQEALVEAIGMLIDANGIADAVLRLTLTRGIGESLDPGEAREEPTILITHKPLLHIGDLPRVERMITVRAIHSHPAIGVRLKALNYLPAVVAAGELRRAGAGEGLLLTAEGVVAEGTVSTIFSVRGGRLRTPPLELGVLPGITRGRVLELARALGIEVCEEQFGRASLLAGEECFYANSVRELVAVDSLDGERFAAAAPGEVTRRLLEAYRGEIPNEEA
ncbi:MAG TPA: aminotransferase class IV [Candidatus Kapabacteria bacterium]|nr:aminotransferase class IV [Candidatus Kapabacteria bacterium]